MISSSSRHTVPTLIISFLSRQGDIIHLIMQSRQEHRGSGYCTYPPGSTVLRHGSLSSIVAQSEGKRPCDFFFSFLNTLTVLTSAAMWGWTSNDRKDGWRWRVMQGGCDRVSRPFHGEALSAAAESVFDTVTGEHFCLSFYFWSSHMMTTYLSGLWFCRWWIWKHIHLVMGMKTELKHWFISILYCTVVKTRETWRGCTYT